MWFARGVQSAIFYYATCTPCAAAEDRRRRKKEAIRAQREQAKSTAVVTDQPRPFPQPTPFSTNAGWMEEIALGPGPPTRRHRTRNNQSDALPRLSSTSSMTVEGSVMSAGREKSTLSERFHWSRFQREDEVLWGEEEEEEEEEEEQEGDGMEERRGKDGAKAGRGSSVNIPRRFRSGTRHSNKYYIARAPPVNDLHPPIVSGPTSRAETRWMLQPPPSAKVMAGKARHDEFRESRNASVRRRSRMDLKLRETEKEEEADDEELVQEGQLSSISERPSWLMSKATNSYWRTCENHKKHRPATLELDTVLTSPDGVDGAADPIQPPPTAATTLETPRSTFMTNALAYDEWHLPLSPSFHSPSASPSSMGSLDDSLQWPDTPYSRPDSKRTPADSSNKGFHPSYLNLTVATNRDTNKSIEAIHLEIKEPRSRDQMQPPKWRWSFDI